MVRFEDVWLQYRRAGVAPAAASHNILSGLSFDIPDGGFCWLTGPSGAGKTSILKLIYLAERPAQGRIEILGTRTARLSRRNMALLRRRIGVVYQDFRLLPHLSAYDNVALPLRLARKSETQIRAEVTELLRWVGLSGKLGQLPDELSGGEQQRIAIARAVICRPRLLVADEPTGNLDDEQAERLMQLMIALNRQGTTVIIATHNHNLIARHTAHALEIASGRLINHG